VLMVEVVVVVVVTSRCYLALGFFYFCDSVTASTGAYICRITWLKAFKIATSNCSTLIKRLATVKANIYRNKYKYKTCNGVI